MKSTPRRRKFQLHSIIGSRIIYPSLDLDSVGQVHRTDPDPLDPIRSEEAGRALYERNRLYHCARPKARIVPATFYLWRS